MKTNNKHNKGFFTRLLMALAIMTAVIITDSSVALAAEPAEGIRIEILGDSEITIKRGTNYIDPGFKVVNEKGQELPDLHEKVEIKFYEFKQVDGKWQEVLLNPFDTNRIAKVKVRYSVDVLVDGKVITVTKERDLNIVDQFDPEYNAWATQQIALQKAYNDAEKLKGTSVTISTVKGAGDSKKTSDGKNHSDETGGTNIGGGGGNIGDGGSGGTGGTNIGDGGSGGSGGTNIGGGGGSLGDGGSGGTGGTNIGGGGGNLGDSGTGGSGGTNIGG